MYWNSSRYILFDEHLPHMWLRTGQWEMITIVLVLSSHNCQIIHPNAAMWFFLLRNKAFIVNYRWIKMITLTCFHHCELFFVTKPRTCHAVNLAVAACEHDICLSSRLNIQRQSVSGIPVAALCAEAAIYTDKSLIKMHNNSVTKPIPLDQQNRNSVTVSLKLHCRSDSHFGC